jgi:hypothetical protein
MALFDKLKNSGNLSLKGNPGPNFENEGQRASSNIQALAKNNTLISSQDMILGRTYGNGSNRVRVNPSVLDLNGDKPLEYVKTFSTSNSGNSSPQFNSSTGTGFTLDKRLPLSILGLSGNPGPTFENESQRTTSDIQALARNNQLASSQDLLTGRKYGRGRFTVFIPPSEPPVSVPNAFAGKVFYPSLGGPYNSRGPRDGRY